MNLREIAKKLNVSPGTVSIALSGNPRGLPFSEQTLKRIRAYAKRVGYVPNRLAQKIFHPERENAIGVVFLQDTAVDRNLPLIPHIINRVSAQSREYQILGSTLDRLAETMQLLRGMNIRQVITIGMTYANDFLGLGKLKDMEIFATDYIGNAEQKLPSCIRCACTTNRYEFHMKLVENIVKLGLDPIAANSDVEFLHKQGIIPEKLYFDHTYLHSNLFDFGYGVALNLIPAIRKGQCRTIIMHNDRIAAGALKAFIEHTVDIPNEVQVLGFNNSDYANYLGIPLTSVQVPTASHLDKILDFLLDGCELPNIIFSPLQFIPRASTTGELNRLYLNSI